MVGEAGRAKKVLVVNPGAGSVDDADAARLRQAFPDYLQLTLEPGEDLGELLQSAQLTEDARVVAVGGDGTVRGVANTPFTGARIEVGDSTPADPFLELTVNLGRTRFDILRRLVRALLRRPAEAGSSRRVRKLRVETSPPMRVYADVTEVGETPAQIEAVAAGLTVIL